MKYINIEKWVRMVMDQLKFMVFLLSRNCEGVGELFRRMVVEKNWKLGTRQVWKGRVVRNEIKSELAWAYRKSFGVQDKEN